MNRKNILLIFLSLTAGLICLISTSAAAKRELSFGIAFGDGQGMSAAQELESMDALARALSDNDNFTIRIKKYSSYENIILDAAKGKVDIFMMYDKPFLFDNWDRLKVWPLATIATEGSARSTPCFWVRKGAEIKTPSDLVGKNIVVPGLNPWYFIKIRDLLHRNGLDSPLWMVFDKITRVPNRNSTYIAVAKGDVDVLFGYDYEKAVVALMNAQIARRLDSCFCMGKDHGNVIIALNRRTTTETEYRQFQDVLKNFKANESEYAKKIPQLQMFLRLQKMAKAEMIPADGTELSGDLALYRKSLKNGWMIEGQFISDFLLKIPKGQPAHVVLDYGICKKLCRGLKFECIDKCMK